MRKAELDTADVVEALTLVVGEIDRQAVEVLFELLEPPGTDDRMMEFGRSLSQARATCAGVRSTWRATASSSRAIVRPLSVGRLRDGESSAIRLPVPAPKL